MSKSATNSWRPSKRSFPSRRMIEMMLTERKYRADEGLALGLNHFVVGEGEALEKAQELACRIASNALRQS